LIDRLLKMSTDGSVRSQDVFYIFATLANNKAGMQPSWQYVQVMINPKPCTLVNNKAGMPSWQYVQWTLKKHSLPLGSNPKP
jgi:hypothetical protein